MSYASLVGQEDQQRPSGLLTVFKYIPTRLSTTGAFFEKVAVLDLESQKRRRIYIYNNNIPSGF